MRNGDSTRPESPLICASGELKKESRRDREESERIEREKCIRVSTVDKCTCIPSYCISSNYSPRFYNDRDKIRGEDIFYVCVWEYVYVYVCVSRRKIYYGKIILLNYTIFIRKQRKARIEKEGKKRAKKIEKRGDWNSEKRRCMNCVREWNLANRTRIQSKSELLRGREIGEKSWE